MKKRNTALIGAVLLAFSLLLSSCSSGKNSVYDMVTESAGDSFELYSYKTDYGYADMEAPMEDMVMMEPEAAYDGGEGLAGEEAGNSVAQTKRKIIYRSSFSVQTKEYDKSLEALKALCDKYGAYFESSETESYNGSERSSHYTIRVPIENYTAFTGETGTLGTIITTSENNQDVTEQYFDVEARLDSAKLREERVLEILKNADKLDDVLALERELADIRYEIESYTGTLRKFDSLVSYATVNLSLREVKVIMEQPKKVLTFGERLDKGFNSGVEDFKDGFEDFVVALSYDLIPLCIWLVILVIVVLIIVKLVKKTKKKNAEYRKAVEAARMQRGGNASAMPNAQDQQNGVQNGNTK